MQMSFSLLADRGDATEHIYLEVAAALTTFLTLGRLLEQRARRRAGSAMRALLALGAQDVAVPVAELRPGDEFVVRPG